MHASYVHMDLERRRFIIEKTMVWKLGWEPGCRSAVKASGADGRNLETICTLLSNGDCILLLHT